jgi:hypothetical protein
MRGVFRLVVKGGDSGNLKLFYRGDLTHSDFDDCAFWAGDRFVAVEDAGDSIHAHWNVAAAAIEPPKVPVIRDFNLPQCP